MRLKSQFQLLEKFWREKTVYPWNKIAFEQMDFHFFSQIHFWNDKSKQAKIVEIIKTFRQLKIEVFFFRLFRLSFRKKSKRCLVNAWVDTR